MPPRRHRKRKRARRDSAPGAPLPADQCDDDPFAEPDWVWVGDRRMFVVGYTVGGVPFGCYEDELEDLP